MTLSVRYRYHAQPIKYPFWYCSVPEQVENEDPTGNQMTQVHQENCPLMEMAVIVLAAALLWNINFVNKSFCCRSEPVC